MALVLDTSTLATLDRSEAFRDAMQTAGIPAHLTLPGPADSAVRARLDLWAFGVGNTTLLRRASTGLRLARTAKQLRVAAPERVALVLAHPRRLDLTPTRRRPSP